MSGGLLKMQKKGAEDCKEGGGGVCSFDLIKTYENDALHKT